MTRKFTAKFSNGVVVTRSTEHTYLYAVGIIDRETGEVTATFTASSNPKPDWSRFGTVPRSYGSAANRAKWRKQQNAERARYDVEIVKAVLI